MRPPKKNATVYDIAKEAGVSISTVSRVLTGSAPVRQETRQRVEEVMQKYNYQPNALARGLSTKESRTLGFILPDITNPFFSTVFYEAEKHALELDYTLFLCNSMNDSSIESKYLRILTEKQVDGILFMGGRINKVRTDPELAQEMHDILESTPIVMINGRMKGVDCHKVYTDERTGILALMEYFANTGHKTVGLIGGLPGITAHDIKLRAFRQGVERYGIEYREEWIVPGKFSIDGGITAMESLLQVSELPDAVMAINDVVAVGAIKTLERHGLRVPDDISIAGFDDIGLAAIYSPSITTVSQNFVELGRMAVEVLVGLISGQNVRKETVIQTSLVIRESCCRR